MKVTITDEDSEDLEQIIAFLNSNSSKAAVSFLTKFRGKVNALTANPHMGKSVNLPGVKGIRRVNIGYHGIYYSVSGDLITVVRVLQGARLVGARRLLDKD